MNTPARLTFALFAILVIQLEVRAQEVLPGTKLLEFTRPLDEEMVAGIDRFSQRALREAPKFRDEYWGFHFGDVPKYLKSIQERRDRFRVLIGAVDPRPSPQGIERISTIGGAELVAEAGDIKVLAVRWPALDGITGEGLLLIPAGKPKARIVFLPDADWTPEMLCGLVEGVEPAARIPLQLVQSGCQVLVPTMISRASTHSGNPAIRMTNQPHREFIYRMAFQMGRHIIGYEVQKVLSAVDQFERLNQLESGDLPIGVGGIGEGGLIALYSSALDERIDSTLVCGYFAPRENLWQEPIYRNVWSLVREFGDSGIAYLIAPRHLVIEACAVPEVAGPPAPEPGRGGGAAPGRIENCTVGAVREEVDRALETYSALKLPERLQFVTSREGDGPAGSPEAIKRFLQGAGIEAKVAEAITWKIHALPDAASREHAQFREMVDFTQQVFRLSARHRDQYWKNADRTNVETWTKTAAEYRHHVWEEMIGKLPDSVVPPNPRTRKVLDNERYVGYEVVLDLYPDVIAGGILLLPKGIKAGEKRPVVVCQHGLEGVPMDTITRDGQGFQYYSAFADELAKRGFVTFSPQNPYRGQDKFRVLQRMNNPMKRSIFSFIIRQHERIIKWLAEEPYVDPERIAFYGLSYGGKTAVRVPTILPGYCLSICSADYNEWILKNVSSEDPYSYMFTGEYEMYEWNMGHVANYAELATLMTPRPFMVERGHFDGVAPDEWVAWEYAKVRRHYDLLGLGDRTEIEFFTGPHKINGVATYKFLHRHLNWPEK